MSPKTNATHRFLRHVKHDGVYYAPGDAVALSENQADELSGHIEPLSDGEASGMEVALDLESFTKNQLVAYGAESYGLSLKPSSPKPELIATIKAAVAAKTDE